MVSTLFSESHVNSDMSIIVRGVDRWGQMLFRAKLDCYQDRDLHMQVFLIRNHFISSLVLDSLKFKKLLELKGKS